MEWCLSNECMRVDHKVTILTELIGREVFVPVGVAVGHGELVTQLQALARRAEGVEIVLVTGMPS